MHTVKNWSHPEAYLGATWEGWSSAGFGQSRDSDALEQSNFQVTYAALKPLMNPNGITDGDETEVTDIRIVREGHWAVGWVEWIAIHNSNVAALKLAQELCDKANDYPILDEEDFSRIEDEQCVTTWEYFTQTERINYLRRHSYTAERFSDLLQAVKGSWYHAANMLHSPSDILY